MKKYTFLLTLFWASLPDDSLLRVEAGPPFSKLTQGVSRRGLHSLSKSIPALSVWESQRGSRSASKSVEVAVKRKRKPDIKLPSIDLRSEFANGGFYYGITRSTLTKASKVEAKKRMNLSDSMSEALEELKFLRLEMETMRKEVQILRGKMFLDEDVEVDSEEEKAKKIVFQRRRAKEADKLSAEIETWAKKILEETEENGWRQVECSKMMRKSLNPEGRTSVSIKVRLHYQQWLSLLLENNHSEQITPSALQWMKDSRGSKADKNDDTEYPCIRCSSTIDAPMEDVCTYLSEESAAPDYNDLVVKYKDVEEISPNAKICASWTPQILFIKQREFITLCHHRWKRDGSEIIVNQAWDHEDHPASTDEKGGKACRAYALRGANSKLFLAANDWLIKHGFSKVSLYCTAISRCPEDPEKTVLTMIAHANPGGNVPAWACKTAVNALAPVEPFKIFQKINQHVKQNQPKLRERLQEAEMVSLPGGRSPRPAGIAQLGYACFWPNGGGSIEGGQLPKVSSIESEAEMPSLHEENEEDIDDPRGDSEGY